MLLIVCEDFCFVHVFTKVTYALIVGNKILMCVQLRDKY